ncbi:ABC transporter permease [Maribellus maritimus]|uniref:ABC transporter permease n=1 Tax=Maribellus maritimus TaxID=2870838 RepID=UPI001EEA920B|nr:ABC transporter permease [Maribellus maritimus]MCG6188030.1 ABC transporter permease [Maribellus maritimus]
MKLHKLKITIRNARKNSILSFAKLFGLSLSFAVVLFATGYVYYETSFDKSITDYDKIYRCLMQGQLNEEKADFAVTSPEQAAAMVNDIPEITEALRLLNNGIADFKIDDKSVTGGPLFYVDPNFFSFFGISLKTNVEGPLAAENNLIISNSIAEKQFGSIENALGKVVELRDEKCIVTGVFDDLPDNFHLRIDLIQSIEKSNPEKIGWGSQSYTTYFKTNQPNINVADLNFKISKCVYLHSDDRVDAANAKTIEDLKYSDSIYLFYTCEPLTDIHFSNHKFDSSITSNKTYVYGAVILAILVLLISSVNFINLTIANISTRLKEVGIRKSIGAFKTDITSQFLYETLVFFVVSFFLAVTIYLIAWEPLAHYLDFTILLSNKHLLEIIASGFVILLIFNLAANIFPIILTSNKRVLELIKNESNVKRRLWGNNSFILIQFVLSGLIILSSLVVQKQINFVVNKDRGYNTENVMMFSLSGMEAQQRKTFLDNLKTYNAVKSVSTSSDYFGNDFGMTSGYFETREDKNYFHTSRLPADAEFQNTFEFRMQEGRYFDKERQTDFEATVLNETAANEYRGEGSLIGKDLILGNKTYHIIGIVKDFNFQSLHHRIEPLAITLGENFENVYVKIRTSQVAEVLGIIKTLWDEFKPDFAFEYKFHDEVLMNQYVKDQQAKKMLLFLSLISIVIACVGLYAVSFFSIIRKTKEIGIRKVNGANIAEILTMLNKDFVKWVALAFIIATPVSFYFMSKWLENFAYKTNLSWWIFALAGLLAMGIALLTVSWQSWRAATRNPVEALRYE